MLDVTDCIKTSLFFEGPEALYKPLFPGETYLGSDLFCRVFKDKVIIYYMESSDQIEIPRSYLNLFQILNTRDGERLRGIRNGGLQEFISLGIELPGILLFKTDPRGIRNIICKMVLIGTLKIREVIDSLTPWKLSNINNTIEI